MIDRLHPAFAVLLVDDEPAWLRSASLTLERAGLDHLIGCSESVRALEVLEKEDVGVVLLDLNMPVLSGEDLLARIARDHPGVAVIVVSGMNQVDTAVRCMKMGAHDYHVKTDEEGRLVAAVLRAVAMQALRRENQEVSARFLSGELRHPEAFAEIVTQDRTMLALFSYLEAVARSRQPLLVTGECGTGKELVAWAAHRLSGYAGKLVSVTVSGLDDGGLADALQGQAGGAPGQARPGALEEATGGTLFLQEIGDLSPAAQAKLLRVLQEGEYIPAGSERPRRVEARVIATTSQDLEAKEQAGAFRRDLHYRLGTHRVHLPPLRERRGDLPLLLDHFLEEAAQALTKRRPTPPKQLAQLLATYDFPGNVRELRDLVFEAVRQHQGRVLSTEVFLRAVGRRDGQVDHPAERNPFSDLERIPSIRDAFRLLVEEAMARASGNQTVAARLLGVSQSALSKRLKSLRG